MWGRLQTIVLLLGFLNSAIAQDYTGRLGAEKGGDPSLVGGNTDVSPSNTVGHAPANTEPEGASSDRPLSPGDPASPAFDFTKSVHKLSFGRNVGSAVYIGEHYISAAHMLNNSGTYITKIDDKQYGGDFKRANGPDICWFTLVDTKPNAQAKAVMRELKDGEQLTLVGKMTGIIVGTVSYDREFKDGSVWISTPGHGIIPGDSGGGAFDKDGNLVAILIGDDPETDHVFVAPLVRAINQIPSTPNLTSVAMQHPVEGVKYLLFSAAWCGPCRIVKQTVLPELAKNGYTEATGNVEVIDIDKSHNLAVKYDVMAIPLWVVLKDGKEIGREVGGSVASLLRRATDR